MTAGDLFERAFEGAVGPLGEARAFEQLVGNALKRRYDADDLLAALGVEENAAHLTDRRRSRQRRSADLSTFTDPGYRTRTGGD